MSGAHIADMVSLLAAAAAVIFLIMGRKRLPPPGVTFMLAAFLTTIMFRDAVNLARFWNDSTGIFETYSEILQITTPILWSFFIFSFLLRVESGRFLRAERRRRISKLFYFRVFRNFPQAIFVLDHSGRILYSNKIASEWLERPPEELIGLNVSDFSMPEEDDDRDEEEKKKKKKDVRAFRTTYVSRSGRQILSHVVELPVRFEWLDAVMRVSSDITARSRLGLAQ